MRLFLIGFMGSGKSHTGGELARLLKLPFIDLDDHVVARAGCSIAALFERRGEAYFRELEGEVLRSLTPLPSFVMATGGGTPCYGRGIEHMNGVGTTVFIDPPIEVLVSRLRHEVAKRPLLATAADLEKSIAQKLALRRHCYEKADLHLRPDHPKTDVARLIVDRLADFNE